MNLRFVYNCVEAAIAISLGTMAGLSIVPFASDLLTRQPAGIHAVSYLCLIVVGARMILGGVRSLIYKSEKSLRECLVVGCSAAVFFLMMGLWLAATSTARFIGVL